MKGESHIQQRLTVSSNGGAACAMECRHERPRAPLAKLAFRLGVSRRCVHGEQMCPPNTAMNSSW